MKSPENRVLLSQTAMSSVIDNNYKNNHRTVVRVILYSKEYVDNYEVEDHSLDIEKTIITKEVADLLFVL